MVLLFPEESDSDSESFINSSVLSPINSFKTFILSVVLFFNSILLSIVSFFASGGFPSKTKTGVILLLRKWVIVFLNPIIWKLSSLEYMYLNLYNKILESIAILVLARVLILISDNDPLEYCLIINHCCPAIIETDSIG